MANSFSLGNMLGDDTSGGNNKSLRLKGAIVGIVFFWMADFSINAVQLPCRALATDVIPPHLQEEVSARFSMTDNLGKIFACELSALSKPFTT